MENSKQQVKQELNQKGIERRLFGKPAKESKYKIKTVEKMQD
jgi:hypothetical protein